MVAERGSYRGSGGQGRDGNRGSGSRDNRGRDNRYGNDRRDDRGPRRDDRGRGDRGPRRDDRGGPKKFDNKPHTREYKSSDPNEPLIPAGVGADQLDKEAMQALSTLAGANREIVARHLVMAGQVLDVDPELAYQHAQAAVKRAGRIDVVREAAALTAYATGRYEEALREVRAVRRMRGDESLRAIEADSERGLGRPERAVRLVEEAELSKMPLSEQVELVLVSAGARADLGQMDVALLILEDAIHRLPETADPFLAGRLQSYRADVLRSLGREEEALEAESQIPEPEETIEIVDLEEVMDADVDSTRTSLRGSNGPLLSNHDGVVLDLDGVCFNGTAPINHAAEALTEADKQGKPLAFATNNASRTPAEVAEKLLSFDIPAQAEQVFTSGMDLMFLLKEELEPGTKVLVVGTGALEDQVRDAGFVPVRKAEEDVVAVAQGYGPEVGWESLSQAAYAISSGARYYATNLDTTLPTEDGMALGNGALVAAVTRATGRRPAATGKPHPEIMQRAAELIHSERPIAVGDRLETDTVAAIAARFPTMHVLTGVSSAADVIRAEKGKRPSYLALDLRGLFEEHPRPKHHRDGTWTVGSSQPVKLSRWGTPSFSDIELRDDGDPVLLSLDNYRAYAAAAWEQADSGRPVRVVPFTVVPNDDPEGTVTRPNYISEEDAEASEAEQEARLASEGAEEAAAETSQAAEEQSLGQDRDEAEAAAPAENLAQAAEEDAVLAAEEAELAVETAAPAAEEAAPAAKEDEADPEEAKPQAPVEDTGEPQAAESGDQPAEAPAE